MKRGKVLRKLAFMAVLILAIGSFAGCNTTRLDNTVSADKTSAADSKKSDDDPDAWMDEKDAKSDSGEDAYIDKDNAKDKAVDYSKYDNKKSADKSVSNQKKQKTGQDTDGQVSGDTVGAGQTSGDATDPDQAADGGSGDDANEDTTDANASDAGTTDAGTTDAGAADTAGTGTKPAGDTSGTGTDGGTAFADPDNLYIQISDGTSSGQDQYKTDPVPEGQQEPVEPDQLHVDTSKDRTCTLSISCETILDNMGNLTEGKESLVPSDGVIFASRQVTFYEGETVFDVLQRETRDNRIHMEYSFTPMYNSNYIEGIHNLYEFDCGNDSGWMYEVNGWYPNYGCSRYVLKDGDDIQWHYTCDLGRDLGVTWMQ